MKMKEQEKNWKGKLTKTKRMKRKKQEKQQNKN